MRFPSSLQAQSVGLPGYQWECNENGDSWIWRTLDNFYAYGYDLGEQFCVSLCAYNRGHLDPIGT